MLKENKDKNKKFPEEMDFKVSSSTDCTGLLTHGPGTPEELEEYYEMYAFYQDPLPYNLDNSIDS